MFGIGEDRRRVIGVSSSSPVAANDGGGSPAALCGWEEAWKLHDAMGKLFVGSIGAEVKQTRGLSGELPAAAVEMVAGSAPARDGERVRAREVH